MIMMMMTIVSREKYVHSVQSTYKNNKKKKTCERQRRRNREPSCFMAPNLDFAVAIANDTFPLAYVNYVYLSYF